jgi:hypothetical protein
VHPKAKKGSESAKTGVRRARKSAERHEALTNRALWTHAAKANNARTTSGAEDIRPNRSTAKPTGNQISHSIAPIDHKREHPASRFRRRKMPSLIGIATNGAKRLAPANQMNSSGTLWAWAALVEKRISTKGPRNRALIGARRSNRITQPSVLLSAIFGPDKTIVNSIYKIDGAGSASNKINNMSL